MNAKNKLGTATALAVACSVLLAAGLDDTAKGHIKAMQDDGSITNVVNMLVTNGTICAVRGHSWGNHMHVTLEYWPSRIGCRECKICGLHQSQYATEWK